MYAICLSVLHAPSQGDLLFWCLRCLSSVQFTLSIVCVSCMLPLPRRICTYICVVNMVPTPAQPPGPGQEVGDFPSSWPGHLLPRYSLTHSLTHCLSNMFPLGAWLPPCQEPLGPPSIGWGELGRNEGRNRGRRLCWERSQGHGPVIQLQTPSFMKKSLFPKPGL